MTTASVKNVGAMLLGTAAQSNRSQSATESFRDVWNSQTGQRIADGDRNTRGDSLNSKELAERTRNEAGSKKVWKDSNQEGTTVEDEEERAERAGEVLGTAAAEIFSEVAEVLEVSEEELQALMDEMGMEPMDLLDQTKLGELILKVSGSDDFTALLTNEELFADYKGLMDSLSQVLQQSGDTLKIGEGELKNLLMSMKQEPNVEPKTEQMPEISVEISEEATMAQPENAEKLAENAEDMPDMVQKGESDNRQVEPSGIQKPDETTATVGNTAGKADTGKEQQNTGQQHSNEGSNLLLQNIRQEFSVNQAGTAAETMESYFSAETQDIMRQVMDFMRIQIKPDMSELQMQLHPESLGTLQINVAAKGGVLTAQFVTQNESVKAALESQMVQLKENFAEQGVKVEAIEVSVQTHTFEQNLEQGRGGSQQDTPEQRSRTRRISLNDLAELSGLGDLNEEEQMAVDLMAANGNTVDYTA